ncbi:GDSL-type esterase/lipase family protein [Solidesulfovibrio sp.]|uniref:alginate O-acetyltransferase AlgX-related protein n=1 Tax=Solidesulfovibrio sp. TaxID=2910990 RepID=UPI002633ABE8|nr:GDSL-type esterase/lipase family protein [Solidesulfovibrio sp.]
MTPMHAFLHHQSRRGGHRRAARLLILVAALYLALVGLDAFVYRVLPRLDRFSEKHRELLYSYGVYDPATNPLYRPWLHGYVNAPGLPPCRGTADDAYRAYGVALPDPPAVEVSGTDALGWWNGRTPSQAETLFIGDSFCYGAGSGTAQSIPALYEKRSGKPVYAACKNGYGLPQYRDILRRLTEGAPAGSSERFAGREVVVLVYVGNDLAADLFVYRHRQAEERLGVSRHFRLASLGRLYRYLRDADAGQGQALAAPPPAAVDTQGYYPVPLTVPTERGLPFAFHPFYRSFIDASWFGAAEENEVRQALSDLRALAQRAGLSLRVVVLPTALQVLYPRIDFTAVPRRSEFAAKAADAARNLNALTATLLAMLRTLGIATVDMEPALMDAPDAGRCYWPTDTHLTPLGNAVVAKALLPADFSPAPPAAP